MNYVITGGAGNISNPLAERLLAGGHSVTVISRNEEHVASLVAKGARPAIGSVEDISFLTKTFTGADAVYTMIPPKWDAADWKGYIEQIGKNYAAAIKAAGVKYVVNLSSIGAHMNDGCGPVSGLHRAENALNTLTGTNIKHLRPAFFYTNLLANIGMIKNMGIIGGNYGNDAFPLTHPTDIAEAAAEELSKLNFSGNSLRYVSSDEKNGAAIAKVIGTAIGKPDLQWIVFTDEQSLQGAMQAGLSEEVAKNYTEMGHAIASGEMSSDYNKHKPATFGKIKLEDFAKDFAAAFNSTEVAAH
jgi:uncharacterized protein YbjT (DUF2867 family)